MEGESLFGAVLGVFSFVRWLALKLELWMAFAFSAVISNFCTYDMCRRKGEALERANAS